METKVQDKQPTDESGSIQHDSSHNLRARAFSALGGTAIVVVFDRSVQIIILAVLARLLTPEQTGVAAAASAVVGIVGLLVSLGVPTGLIQARVLTASTQAVARAILLATAILAVIFVQILAPYAGTWFRNPDVTAGLRVLTWMVLVQPIAQVASASLARKLRARDIALADLAASFLAPCLVTIPLAISGFGFWALIYGTLAQITVRGVFLCLFARERILFRMDWREGLVLCRRGSGFLMNGFLNRAVQDVSRWTIGRYLPVGDLGLFARANSLMGYPAGLFSAAVDRVMFPAVALVQDYNARLKAGAADAVRLTAIVGLPLTVALFLLGRDIILVVLGPTWVGAVEPFQILCLATYSRLADRVNWVILRGLGQPYRLALLQVISLSLMVGGCVLGARAGLSAIAFVVMLVTTVSYLLNTIAAMKASGVSMSAWFSAHRQGGACSLLTVLVIGPLTLFMHAAHMSSIIVLGSSVAASIVAGSLAIWLAPTVFIGAVGTHLLTSLHNLVLRKA